MSELYSLIDIPKYDDDRGALSFLESSNHLGFPIKRIYYLYNVPAGKKRGAHAHKDLKQCIIAMAGSATITLDNGTKSETLEINRPNQGLLVGNMIWRDLENFSKDAVILVLASHNYDENDYIHDYNEFLELTNT